MFFGSLKDNLILAALAVPTALWAVPEARATIILSESSSVSADTRLGEDLAACLEIDPVANAGDSSLGGMTGLPLMPTDEEREQEAQKDRLLLILHGSLMDAPADMSPSSNSLSQLTSSAASAAGLANSFFSLSSPPLVGRVTPEVLPHLSTGPPFELLRPA